MIEVISRLHLGDVTLGVVSVDVNFVHDLHQSFTEIDERLLIVLLDKMDMKVINYVQEVAFECSKEVYILPVAGEREQRSRMLMLALESIAVDAEREIEIDSDRLIFVILNLPGLIKHCHSYDMELDGYVSSLLDRFGTVKEIVRASEFTLDSGSDSRS